jgi:hypothetical protein
MPEAQTACDSAIYLHHFITKSTNGASCVTHVQPHLLVERLGVGGGGSDVGIAGSLVGASLLLELLGGLQVGLAGIFVGLLVLAGLADEVSDSGGKEGEHGPLLCKHALVEGSRSQFEGASSAS